MTMRKLGEGGIKLIGVYFAATAVISIARLGAIFVIPAVGGFPNARDMALSSALPIASVCLLAWACLFGGRAIASRLFADDQVNLNALSRRDLLTVGLSLLGVSMALSGVPGLLEFAGKALWYADGSRQAQFLPAMARSWSSVVNNGLELVVGWAVSGGAGKISSKLDGQFS